MKNETIIVVDSCCEIPNDYENVVPIEKVPFHVICNGKDYLDDGTIDRDNLLLEMSKAKDATKSACPSPQDFLNVFEKFKEVKNIFLVTVSSQLSGAYNSAMTAKNMFLENHKDAFIHVFDSMGASTTEMNVVMGINEYIKEKINNLDPSKLVEKITDYTNNLNTYFVLQCYDNFVKSGRISKAKAYLSNALNIVPIMKGENGVIVLADKARGLNKALFKMVDVMKKNVSDFSTRTLSITHCNAEPIVETVLNLINEQGYKFKNRTIFK